MEEIKREKIRPIHVMVGDSLTLNSEVTITWPNGITTTDKTEVLQAEIDREMTVDEVVIFYVGKDDFKGATDGIGGAFLVSEKK